MVLHHVTSCYILRLKLNKKRGLLFFRWAAKIKKFGLEKCQGGSQKKNFVSAENKNYFSSPLHFLTAEL